MPFWPLLGRVLASFLAPFGGVPDPSGTLISTHTSTSHFFQLSHTKPWFSGYTGLPFWHLFPRFFGPVLQTASWTSFFHAPAPNLHLGANRCPKGSLIGGPFSEGHLRKIMRLRKGPPKRCRSAHIALVHVLACYFVDLELSRDVF